eukprot:CAMPEP_0185335436 /NCGR_PEP_ID=MMETSP1363-20130426/87491_1 /TAXON_ID=38817 /ORGANISM="Gephyrocapsa oceanica, Strain RCC1303" /LENGTH=78 /DNA_ID=CAMNT_0027934451 /DNA_START=432 /DNA_END=668 /DNA_ORIENTATION=-
MGKLGRSCFAPQKNLRQRLAASCMDKVVEADLDTPIRMMRGMQEAASGLTPPASSADLQKDELSAAPRGLQQSFSQCL